MLELSSPIELQRPSQIRFGPGCVATLAEWCQSRGYNRVFAVCDPVNAKRLDCLQIPVAGYFADIDREPDTTILSAALDAAKGGEVDLIVGFGGGSAMDLAKLVAVMVNSTDQLANISGVGRAPARKLGLVQIPTTAGTGSEVGTRALITDAQTKNKIATESLHMLADAAFIDPELTRSVPSHVTAATGVDALAHCVEAFTSKRAHPIVDLYALEGIRLAGRFLKRAVDDGNDIEARTGMSLASYYGGLCLGPVNTTAGHAIAYPLGSRHGLPHGIANALIFPHVLAANATSSSEKTTLISQALGLEFVTPYTLEQSSLEYCAALGISMKIRDYNVPENDLKEMADEAANIRRLMDWNPVDLAASDVHRIYQSAW